jgi:hypothetical protein
MRSFSEPNQGHASVVVGRDHILACEEHSRGLPTARPFHTA